MTKDRLKDPAVVSRFWEKVRESDDGCLLWVGHKNTMTGVGLFAVTRDDIRESHLVSYEMKYGPIPEPESERQSTQIVHSCKKPNCVRPEHLNFLFGTERERKKQGRMFSLGADGRPTHCRNGHEQTEENSYIDSENCRRCRICRRENSRRAKKRRKDAKREFENNKHLSDGGRSSLLDSNASS